MQYRDQNPDTWIENCKNQNDLESAIKLAATALNRNGKKHPHQHRISSNDLDIFATELIDKISEIKSAQDFDDIYRIANSIIVPGIGTLTKYDTATRIGAFLKLEPDKIYLHAGTKKGAEKLLRKKIRNPFLLISDLPDEFKQAGLNCSEIEDILCIYKDRFNTIQGQTGRKRC